MNKRVLKRIKRTMIIFLSIILVICVIAFIFMQQPQFGKQPEGERLERIKASENYKDGSFQNLNETSMMSPDVNYARLIWDFIFTKIERQIPTKNLPSVKTDLLHLSSNDDILVWFGHSSYFMQIDGKTILVDPVFSGHASPVSFGVKAFNGTDIYSTNDIPEIDYLFISHDHFDHLDYETVINLRSKVKNVICGLGVGEHFEYWGYNKNIIIEKDWGENAVIDEGFTAFYTPARHFSGRTLSRNNSLWTSFVLKTPSKQIYIGGDSGYDTHFAEIGETFGKFDLVVLENGQYDEKWKYIHMSPEETLKAAKDLNAKQLFPVHSSKFVLANHAWDTPLKDIVASNNDNLSLITPMIGQSVNLNDSAQEFSQWWLEVE